MNCFSFWGTPQTPYRGSAPGPRWGTSVPRPPAQVVPHNSVQVYAPGDRPNKVIKVEGNYRAHYERSHGLIYTISQKTC